MTDTSTGAPLIAVNVFIKDTNLGSATDREGYYQIKNVPIGEYELVVEMMGYEKETAGPFRVVSGDLIENDFSLKVKTLYYNKPVTVTATRGKALATEVPASVDVVSLESLELRKPDNLAEALENIQGVVINDYGGPGDIKSVSLRGSTSAQVLVLIDGQRLNNVQNGQVDLSSVSVEGVEKIEIVRGGNSALYGADAVGGVINIITRKNAVSEGVELTAEGMAGSFGTNSYRSGLGFKSGGVSASASYKRMISKGDFSYTDRYGNETVRRNSDFASHDVFAKFRGEFGEPHYRRAFELFYKYFTTKRGSPGGIDVPYYEARSEETNQQLNYIFTGKVFNVLNDLRLQGYAHLSRSTYDNEEGLIDVHSLFKNRAYGSEAQVRSVITDRHVITYGAGARYDWLEARDFPENETRTAYHLFLLGESNFPLQSSTLKSVYIVPSLRYDGTSDFENRLTPKIGSVLNFGRSWQTAVKFNVGMSYRAPTFNDLYWPEDAWTKGNPDLKPESGYDWDVGLRLQYPSLNGIYFESTYFMNKMNDLILWQEIAGIWSPDNVQKSKTQGLENSLSLNLVPRRWTLSTNYTFLYAKNLSDDHTLKDRFLVYRPGHMLNVSSRFKFGIVTILYQYNYTSKRYSKPDNNKFSVLEPYSVTDFTLSLKPVVADTRMKFSVQVKNLFDEEFQVIKYHPVPGREYRFMFGINLK